MKMKALVYYGWKKLCVEQSDVPPVGDKDVLIRIKYCGVCGTDIHIYNGEGGAFNVNPPLIMGHEISGIVVQTGCNVTKVEKGDLVSVDPNEMCGECYFCKNAMQHFCKKTKGYGTTLNGGFAEYCLASEKQIFKFKNGISPLAVCMTEPLSCCIHGIDLCNISAGDEVLIIGGGPIGLLMLQLIKISGAAKIILSEPVRDKRALGVKFGADIVIDPVKENIENVLKKSTENIDVVIECVGNTKTIEQAILFAGKGARVMLFGLTGQDASMRIKPDVLFKKELKIMSSFINPYTFGRAVSLIESEKINVTDIVTDVIELKDSVRIFENAEFRKRGKTVIKVS